MCFHFSTRSCSSSAIQKLNPKKASSSTEIRPTPSLSLKTSLTSCGDLLFIAITSSEIHRVSLRIRNDNIPFAACSSHNRPNGGLITRRLDERFSSRQSR